MRQTNGHWFYGARGAARGKPAPARHRAAV